MAHTTERATLVLCAYPDLVTTVQATTADVEESDENSEALEIARDLLELFPAKVQRAASMRTVIVPRRLAIMASVRVARIQKYGEGGQAERVSGLLEALADAPGDVLRYIVEEFVGEGEALEQEGEEEATEQEGEESEELGGEGKLTGKKRGRED